jgi:Kef-type K+ transport system membrane component KefB
MSEILYIAIIIFAGLFCAKALSYFKLPDVTGYLVAGLIIGPSLLGLVPAHIADSMGNITQVALGFIAFSIGSEINFQSLKKIGPKVLIITLSQALGAWFAVFVGMFLLFHQSLSFSLVIAAIAVATAPAATLMVIKQYQAKGPVVNMLLPVVALDDVIGVIIFGLSLSIAKSLNISSSNDFSLIQSILQPVLEIAGSILAGFLLGFLMALINKKLKNDSELLSVTIAFIFFGAGFALSFHLSSLLLCMAMGSFFSSLTNNVDRMLFKIENFTPPIYVTFFTLAGINLHLSMLKEVGLIGLAYVIIRVIGKVSGSWFGAWRTKAPKTIQKYLGFTLIPQAGVAIGLAMLASTAFPEFGSQIRTIILGATVIYELVGPYITKACLYKAGEINPQIIKAQ